MSSVWTWIVNLSTRGMTHGGMNQTVMPRFNNNASFRSLKTALFSLGLGLSHLKRF